MRGRIILGVALAAVAFSACADFGADTTTTQAKSWRLEVPIPNASAAWSVKGLPIENGDECSSAAAGRVDVKDGTGEIIGTGSLRSESEGTVVGLPEDASWLTLLRAKNNGGTCLVVNVAVVPLTRTADIYIIVIKEDFGSEYEIVRSSDELEDLGWLKSG